jgi:MFS family permease
LLGGDLVRAASDPTPYRRDGATWTAFGALFAFGIANAMLGPALPYVRRAEHISYFVAGLHQAAFAIGGLTAGALAARARTKASRRRTICGGLTGAAVAAIGLGYGPSLAWTLAAALAVGFFAVTALIRLWAALADQHGQHRAVAMTEGEVAVSFAGILTPLLIGGLAASALTWRFSFAVVAVVLLLAAGGSLLGPEGPAPVASSRQVKVRRHGSRRGLVVIFAIVALEFTLSFWAATYLQDDVGLARGTAVTLVSALYAANLVGRLLASRLARRVASVPLLTAALTVAMVAMPILLTAHDATMAVVGLAVAGTGIGATFPLASALLLGGSALTADEALGEILTIAGIGEIVGPVFAGALAQATSLRIGLLTLPALIVLGAAGLRITARGSG